MKNVSFIRMAALLLFAATGMFSSKAIVAQRAALVQDVDQAARAPFQATVSIDINNFTFTSVAIPAGKRLVIDTISMNGAATTAGPYVQPVILLSVGVAGNPSVTHYYGPNVSQSVPGQYYVEYPTTIYADTLQIAPAYAGYTPTFLAFTVIITGHLITP